jgi:hypothetical protein
MANTNSEKIRGAGYLRTCKSFVLVERKSIEDGQKGSIPAFLLTIAIIIYDANLVSSEVKLKV